MWSHGVRLRSSRLRRDFLFGSHVEHERSRGTSVGLVEPSPTVIVSDMTVPLCGSSKTHLGTKMPSWGGHIINATRSTYMPARTAGQRQIPC
jgi:hypothetical protein